MTEKNGEARKLPEGWIQLKLENVADWGSGGTPSRKRLDYFSGDIPWIKTGELRSKYIRNTEENITKEAINESSAKLFPKGSVAIAMYGATIGKTSILDIDASTNQACAVAKLLEQVLFNEFLYYYLSSQIRKFVELGKGEAQPNISQNIIKNHLIHLPPFNEQQRIVEKIEELFSELDQGIKSLKTAQKQLQVYRQAVLKWAFEGKLTEKWRSQIQQEKLDIKTGEELLAQIKAERENRYQQQLAEWEEAVREWEAIGKIGKRPTKPSKPKDVLPLTKTELAELPQLPDSWCWVKLGHLTWSVKDGPHYSPRYVENGIPFISGGNVRPEGVDFKNVKYITSELHEELSKRCQPELGDVLYTKGGTIGIARVNTYKKEFNVWVHVAVLKIVKSVNPFFLQNALNSPLCYAQSQKYTHGVGNQDLGLTRMVNIVLSICNKDEQEEVVKEIESIFSICDQLEATIIENLHKAEALRQSLLKQAFEGKLVPQDPNDEPAEKLLERIKQEKLNRQKGKQLSIQGV